MTRIKEISKHNAICERCGVVMNIPKSHARLCYDCEELDITLGNILEKLLKIVDGRIKK